MRPYELVEESNREAFLNEVNYWANEGYRMYRYYKDGQAGIYTAVMEQQDKSFSRR